MKRLISCLLSALLVICVLCACAAAEGELVLQSLKIEDQMLRLIVKANNTNYLQPADFQVQLDAETVTPAALNSMERSGLSTTHLVIVDVSATSSNDGNRIEDMKATLRRFVSSLPAGDNVAVVTPGMLSSSISLSQGSSVLNAVIDGLKFDRKLTGVDSAIREACTFLSSANNLNDRLNILILSNGENEVLSSGIVSELSERIRSLRCSAYTIAYKKYRPDTSALSNFSLMALRSKGGLALEMDYVSQNRAASDEQIAELVSKIRKNESCFFVLDVPLTAETGSFSTVTVRMQQGTMTYTDSLTISAAEQQLLVTQIPTPEPTPEPTLEPTPEPTPEPTAFEAVIDWIQQNVILVVCIAVIIVLVIVLLVVLLKKGKPSEDDVVSGDPALEGTIPEAAGKTEAVISAVQGATEPVRGVRLNIQPVTQGDIVVRNPSAMMEGSAQIGRMEDQCRIVISYRSSDQDIRTISRVHARLTIQGNTILIENLSKNGTKVNNMLIDRPTVLQKNDIITLGAVSFRIMWDNA